jgi:sugar phosphate permease
LLKGLGSNTATIGNSSVTVLYLAGAVGWFQGNGTPEGVVTAPVGSFYSRKDGGAGTSFYVKESGSGNTGWIGK